MSEEDRLRRRLDRERQARKQAEQIAEEKTLQLFQANAELQKMAANLEKRLADLSQVNAKLQRAQMFFHSTLEQMAEVLERGATSAELLSYLDEARAQFAANE